MLKIHITIIKPHSAHGQISELDVQYILCIYMHKHLFHGGGFIIAKAFTASPGNDPQCGHQVCYRRTMMPDGPQGDIWEECTRCGKQAHFDAARDRHVPPEQHKKDFTYTFGMTPCPTCKRRAWKTWNESHDRNTLRYDEECELCGQKAICIQPNLKL